MRIPKNRAQRAAVCFLALLACAFVVMAAFYAYGKFGPKKVLTVDVPFGLPAGTEIAVGDTPDTLAGLGALPGLTVQELHRAGDLERNGRFMDAAEIYEAISLQHPDVFLAEWGVVRTLLLADSLAPVWTSLFDSRMRNIKSRYPESSVSFLSDAMFAAKAQSFGPALELSRISTEKAPAFAYARLFYAEMLYRAGRLSEGKSEVKTAISLSRGTDADAYELLSRIFHDEGDLDSCERVIDFAVSKFPVHPKLLCMQGLLLEYKGRFDDAENVYRRILAIRPDFSGATEALLSLGQKAPPGKTAGRLSPRDQAQVACNILEPLVSRYPDNLPLREALGIAYLKGREFNLAKAQFAEIQNRDPEYPEIRKRLQEASSLPPEREVKKNILADNLNRAIDSMRTLPVQGHSFESSLGHYLVRYGATEKEFFTKYSASNFQKLKNNAWQESFFDAPYFHRYTALFDKKGRFYGVHVVVTDSNVVANKTATNTPEIYTTLLQLNSRLSGLGTETGETDCEGTVISGATWETRDNFEMLARVVGKPAEIRMIRLDKSKIPAGMRLCDYTKYLFLY